MERNWKLGDDMVVSDNLMDGITFDDLILTVHCNCPKITEQAVKKRAERNSCDSYAGYGIFTRKQY